MKWGIPAKKIVSLPLTFLLVKVIYIIGGERLMMHCQWWVHNWFARHAVNYITGGNFLDC